MVEISIQEIMRILSPNLRAEVHDFAAFLLARQGKKQKAKMKFQWQGALKESPIRYTSVELQHKISDMRAGQDETIA